MSQPFNDRILQNPSDAIAELRRRVAYLEGRRRLGSHALYGEAHTDVDTAAVLAMQQQLAWDLDSQLWVPGYRMAWQGERWSVGKTYYPQDVVRDGLWTMVANKETHDRPAPQPVGDPYWVSGLDDSPAWTELTPTATAVYSGQRYTFSQEGYYAGFRVWLPSYDADIYYRFIVIRDPLGIPVIDVGQEFQASAIGWLEIPEPPILVQPGQVYDFILQTTNKASFAEFTGDWFYSTPQQPATPGSGTISHSVRAPDELRVHKTDDGGADRSADLATIKAGDEITGAGMTWTVVDVTDEGTWIRFEVTPATLGGPSGVETFTFRSYGSQPIPYVKIANHYQSNVDVEGLFGLDDLASIATDQDGYGVDIQVQHAQISPDWDALAYSGSDLATGGGSGDHDHDTRYLRLAGGNMSGSIGMGGNSITNALNIHGDLYRIYGHSDPSSYGRLSLASSRLALDFWHQLGTPDPLLLQAWAWGLPDDAEPGDHRFFGPANEVVLRYLHASGWWSFQNTEAVNLVDPTMPQSAATKAYHDANMPTRIAARVRGNAATALPSGTWTPIAFDTVQRDQHGLFSAAGFTYQWSFRTQTNPNPPDGAYHRDDFAWTAVTELYFNALDNGLTDRSTELLSMQIGETLTVEVYEDPEMRIRNFTIRDTPSSYTGTEGPCVLVPVTYVSQSGANPSAWTIHDVIYAGGPSAVTATIPGVANPGWWRVLAQAEIGSYLDTNNVARPALDATQESWWMDNARTPEHPAGECILRIGTEYMKQNDCTAGGLVTLVAGGRGWFGSQPTTHDALSPVFVAADPVSYWSGLRIIVGANTEGQVGDSPGIAVNPYRQVETLLYAVTDEVVTVEAFQNSGAETTVPIGARMMMEYLGND